MNIKNRHATRTYHPQKITIRRTPKQDIQRYFFSEYLFIWKELPGAVVSAHNLAIFKS
jgi:hypothetical protein